MKMTNYIRCAIIGWLLVAGKGLCSEPDTLTILHVNDTHSHLVPFGTHDAQGTGKLGGIARAAALIKQVQSAEKNVLLLHGGDLFMGDLMFNKYFGVPELEILAQLGCVAMAVGNHEFELGPEVLKQSLSTAGFPDQGFDLLSANLEMNRDPDLTSYVKPYKIITVGSVNVGIFGMTTEMTNDFSFPAPDSVTSFIDAAVLAVNALKEQCQVVMALSHLGVKKDSVLAGAVAGIDLIVGGHSHTILPQPVGVLNPEGKTTWIIQTGDFYQNVGNLKCTIGESGLAILDYELMPVDSTVTEDPEISGIVQGLVNDLESDPRFGPVYSNMIAVAQGDIEKKMEPGASKDMPLGNLITDAYRDAAQTQIGLTVWGFIAQKIYGGPLTGDDIFQAVAYGYDTLSGHGYRLMKFNLAGMQLKMGLEYAFHEALTTNDLFVQVSGMQLQYNSSMPMGNKLTYSTMLVNGEPVQPFTVYSVAANSGLYNFFYLASLNPMNPEDAGFTEYEALRDYIVKNSPIAYQVEGRVVDTYGSTVSGEPLLQPESLELFQNYPNPFNTGTTVSFRLHDRGRVRISIFNLEGQSVAVLLNEEKEAGLHSVKWNADHMDSGIYLIELQTGTRSETRKCLLLK